jgi:hypothetical protein
MAEANNNAMISQWLNDKGYSEAEVQKVLAKLEQHDHETLSDAVFDSIGGSGESLDDLIREALKE